MPPPSPPPPTLALKEQLERQRNLPPHRTREWEITSEFADTLPPLQENDNIIENNNNNHNNYIALTFAMPLDQDETGPPLLWKLQLPGMPGVAVEAYTVMEGALEIVHPHGNRRNPNNNNHHIHRPTHIYIHGYQSWSFTGSIVRGDPQPVSAMPDMFSWAFNRGGSPPPEPTVVFADESNDDDSLRNNKTKTHYQYQSDFFTCLSSDGHVDPPTTRRFVLPRTQTNTNSRNTPQHHRRLLDETGGPALLLGWLAQHHHFGVITVDSTLTHLAMHASADATLSPHINNNNTYTDWAYCQLVAPHSYDEEPMVHYLHAVAAHNEARPLMRGPLLTGWCSWYHYYENISADSLRDNFSKLQQLRGQLPTNVAVVDDGYMTAWGDWGDLKPGKFGPAGLAGVAADIREFGMRPGLWLAPFACDKHSKIVRRHPEWIIRNPHGRPANSSNCGKFFYGLDATNPEVREYVYDAIHRAVHDWGFEVLKIDFLYAACLVGNNKYDMSMTRAEAMHLALQTIRAAAGEDVFLIGCGCPIGSGIGYVDGMRVSADTGPTWYPAAPLPWWDHGTLPSLRGMVRNSMTRAPLGHRWWHNDPDCLLLGETTKLSDLEVASAASIVAMTCGMLLLSDDLTKVSPARTNIVSKIFPMAGVSAVVLDLHNTRDGLPSLLRLWCTDRYGLSPPDDFMEDNIDDQHNLAATFFGRQASFSLDRPVPKPVERKRNCIHVCQGLGTWTLLSVSNWLDESTVVHVPKLALSTPPETGWEGDDDHHHQEGDTNGEDSWNGENSAAKDQLDDGVATHPGYHVFAFWSSKYTWIPELTNARTGGDTSLSKHLEAHETELFHIRTVTPKMPQYIGSDIHFSCGIEVLSCKATENTFQLQLNCTYKRVGHIFIYIPRHNLKDLRVSVGVAAGRWDVVGNTPGAAGSRNRTRATPCIGRIVRVKIAIEGGCPPSDGQVVMTF